MMDETYWNGQKSDARRVLVRVGKSLLDTWWCSDLEGTIRKAVEVTYGDKVFYLDNEDGAGWEKVTKYYGSPSYTHSSLPDTSTVLQVGISTELSS